MYKITLAPSFQPHWMESPVFYIPIIEGIITESQATNSISIATYEVNQIQHPLIVETSGSIRYLFDVKETIKSILTERYLTKDIDLGIFSKLPFDYNRFPMWFIGLMAKSLTKKVDLKDLPSFPNYPIDYSVDILKSLLEPEKTSDFPCWPNGKKYAICFTHDVDTEWVFKNDYWFDQFRNTEESAGIRSAWYIVPKEIRAKKTKQLITSLVNTGHEIGAHGYTHDPGLPNYPEDKLLKSFRHSYDIITSLYPNQEIGYRAPWLARNKKVFRLLHETGFFYDSSVPNSDFNGSTKVLNNGCCTVFPYATDGIFVLPLTIPLDVAFRQLNKNPIDFYNWVLTIVEKIKKIGGVVVITTHTSPHFSANHEMMEGYSYFINKIIQDEDAWIALPKDIINYSFSVKK